MASLAAVTRHTLAIGSRPLLLLLPLHLGVLRHISLRLLRISLLLLVINTLTFLSHEIQQFRGRRHMVGVDSRVGGLLKLRLALGGRLPSVARCTTEFLHLLLHRADLVLQSIDAAALRALQIFNFAAKRHEVAFTRADSWDLLHLQRDFLVLLAQILVLLRKRGNLRINNVLATAIACLLQPQLSLQVDNLHLLCILFPVVAGLECIPFEGVLLSNPLLNRRQSAARISLVELALLFSFLQAVDLALSLVECRLVLARCCVLRNEFL
mmetsp:Transcript_79255/g.116143  ORF Transcript_79255/g.116143 Transcript_79255/m.116143 type:complete len:268 (-) Transcript_79255:519-1322(-)